MNNPAPGSRIRSIRVLDLGLAPMSDGCRALVRGYRLMGRGARQAAERAIVKALAPKKIVYAHPDRERSPTEAA
jgi:hypothetical protein